MTTSGTDSVETMVLAEQLHKAITENTEREATIQRVLGTRTFEERQKVVLAYKETYRKNVRESFVGAFASNYNRLVYRLCVTRYENGAFWIRDAAKGWFCTDERALVGLLITYSADELKQVQEAYGRLFDRSRPEVDVEGATSSDFRILLQELWKKTSVVPDDPDPSGQATMLYRATEAKLGTNEREVCQALCSGPRPFLQEVLKKYIELGCEEEFSKCVEKETSGWFKTGLLMLIEWINSPARFYAKELHHALNGWVAVNHCTLRNYVIDRSEIDLADISAAYEELYNRTLADAVSTKLSGAYRDLLLAVINRNSVKDTETPPIGER